MRAGRDWSSGVPPTIKALIVHCQTVKAYHSQFAACRWLHDSRLRVDRLFALLKDLPGPERAPLVSGFDFLVKPLLECIGEFYAIKGRAKRRGDCQDSTPSSPQLAGVVVGTASAAGQSCRVCSSGRSSFIEIVRSPRPKPHVMKTRNPSRTIRANKLKIRLEAKRLGQRERVGG
jgi:hypothetical protein